MPADLTSLRFDDAHGDAPGDALSGPWSALWHVPTDLAYFDGHFPGQPLLPAVIVMEVSLAFLRSLRPGLAVDKARQCKFKAPVRPGDVFRLEASTSDGATWHVAWSPASGDPAEPVVELTLGSRPPA
jgi:3-hydroxymyristoyl/3-hydroxydecanoyl-(acyl carrier protein) dehydratase